MNESDDIINEFNGRMAIWAIPADDVDLAGVAEYVVSNRIDMISVATDSVARIWPWLEGTGVKIMTRFYVPLHARGNAIADLTAQINTAFKHGADGAQIFVHLIDLPRFVSELHAVRDGLFFNKDLCIGIDADEIDALDWGDVFSALNKINATSFVLALPKYSGDKSDWVGRVYGALNSWDFGGELHFACTQNLVPMAQAARLVDALRADIAPRARFWVHAG